MSPPPAPTLAPTMPLSARLHRTRSFARAAILCERAWPGLRMPLAMGGTYLLAGLLRWPQRMPDWLHAAVEAAWLGTALWRAATSLRAVVPPTGAEVDRRIERASRLANQPLLALTDHPALPGAEAVWDAHVSRALGRIGPLRAGWPWPRLTLADRAGVGAMIAALALGAIAAGDHAPSRLAAALRPGWDDADVPLPQIQAWIDMPDYAPGSPIFLQNGTEPDAALQARPASVPDGAALHATLTGLAAKPHGAGADTGAIGIKGLDPTSWQVDAHLTQSGTMRLVARGRTLAQWPISVQPDLAPELHWGPHPGADPQGFRTNLPWTAKQSYGIAMLEAEIRHAGSTRVLRVPITLDGHPRDAHGMATPDLSADPWAGEQVSAVLHARSLSGRESRSTSVSFTLGARSFRDPLARALIDLRRRMALGEEDDPTASDEIAALLDAPKLADARPGAFTELSALATLLGSPDLTAAAADGPHDEAIGVLWYLALYLEDMRHASPEEATAALDIRAAQERVQSQIDRMRRLGSKGHTESEQAELGRRTQALREAIQRRMDLLAQKAMRNGTALPDMGDAMNGPSDELQRMMRDMQSDAANGRSDDAMRKLQQMEDLSERMRNATPQDLANLAKQMQAQMQAQQQMQAVHDMIHRETGLLDHAQARLGAQTKAAKAQQTDQDEDQGGGNDLANMPTAELLRRLGLQPPADMQQQQPAPAQTSPQDGLNALDPDERQRQADQRLQDHAISHALTRAVQALSRETHDLTGKDAKNLAAAHDDMVKASRALMDSRDDDAQRQAQKAIKDLSEASKQMRQAMSQKSAGQPIFLPGMGMGQSSGHGSDHGDGDSRGAQSDDQDKSNRDPLGRHTGEGHDAQDTDTKLPDQQQRDRAREIQRELQRRDSDRTRSKDELDYLDRLLKSF
jgi:uncharacterized protein (TIGR02302 family)